MNAAFIYHLLTFVILPFALLYHWYRSVSRGRKPAFGERFGFLPAKMRQQLSGHPVIWLHAVSVGEVIAARPLIKALRGRFAEHRLLLSVTTETGRNVAEKDALADAVIYFPFDILPAVCRLLDAASPCLIVVMETEIWPVFIREADRRGIPVFLANGRISERSFPRYKRFTWFFRPVLAHFSRLAMQSQADLERIVAIGAPPDRSEVLGNLKYDIPYSPVTDEERKSLRKRFGLSDGVPVLAVGSTHPGEEEYLIKAYSDLRIDFPELVLVLVPRHPERTVEVESIILKNGFSSVRRSSHKDSSVLLPNDSILLIDTIGELMSIYALSNLAYVGGSLVATGGHNLLEPASRGIPFVFGPHMDNFREIAGLALEHGAGVQITDADELADVMRDFLASPELRHVIGSNGLKLMRSSGGAAVRHLEVIESLLRL